VVQQAFRDYQRLVLFMPVGAAVRLLAPCLDSKRKDPAVVCVDDSGRFAVSLLSGHQGGADQLAQEVAQALGAMPVVTSASQVMGLPAVDLLGREFGWQVEASPLAITRASAAVVNGEPVAVYQNAGEPDWWPQGQQLPASFSVLDSPEILVEALAEESCAAALVITDRIRAPLEEPPSAGTSARSRIPVVIYRPRSLVVGMGCRRGVPMAELEALLVRTFAAYDIAASSLRCIATAELKKDEPGIQELARKYGVPMMCYSAEELNSVFAEGLGGDPAAPDKNPVSQKVAEERNSETGATPRPRVHELLGMWGVSEPAALLASGSRELLVARVKTSQATIAVCRVEFSARPYEPS
jgi:cobalt-precorrin 5A hydrolase